MTTTPTTSASSPPTPSSLTADRTSTLHASTFGIAVAGIAAVGAAVAVAEVKGSTSAYIGKGAQLGRSGIGESVGSVGVTATTIASVGPFGDSKTMSVGISAAILGSAAAGVAVGTVWPDTTASIRDDVLIYASGLVSVHADSTLSADVQADGGAIGFVAVGAMVSVATVGKNDGTGTAEHGITRASVGARAVIRAGAASLTARSGAAATAQTVSASGGIYAGDGGSGTATVTTLTEATIGASTVIATIGSRSDATGDVDVLATSTYADADSSARSYGGGGLKIGVIFATSTTTPTVRASIGAGAGVVAAHDVTVKAEALSQPASGTPYPETFTPTQAMIDDDAIVFAAHGLSTGDRVTYSANGNTAIDVVGIGSLDQCVSSSDCREYAAIVVDGDTIHLGEVFSARGIGPILLAGATGDAVFDVVRFTSPHGLQTGDPVVLRAGGLGTNLGPAGTYYVRRIDDFTIALYADVAGVGDGRSLAIAPSKLFAPSSAVGDDDHPARPRLHERHAGDLSRARRRAPSPASPSTHSRIPSSPGWITGCGDLCTNTIFLGLDTNGDGKPDVGHGLQTGDRVDYATTGQRIVSLLPDPSAPYFVIVLDKYTVALADTACHAGVGTFDPTPGNPSNGDEQTPCSATVQDVPNVQRLTLDRPVQPRQRHRQPRARRAGRSARSSRAARTTSSARRRTRSSSRRRSAASPSRSTGPTGSASTRSGARASRSPPAAAARAAAS